MASVWETYWFAPVSTARVFLLLRGFLLVLAWDMWTTRMELGTTYGLGQLEVPHFDAFDPATFFWLPDVYFVCVLLAGFTALVAALSGHRTALVMLFVFYKASWSMSMRDLYQHHYFVSVLLASSVFLPLPATSDFVRGAPQPQRSAAPAYAMVAVSIAIVYAFAAVAKCDPEWLSGATLQAIEIHTLLDPSMHILGASGPSETLLFRWVGVGSIALEGFLALAFLAAPMRDRSPSGLASVCWTLTFALAASLHLGFELMGLKIGWFSTYMVWLAGVFFLPERWLLMLIVTTGEMVEKGRKQLATVRSPTGALRLLIAGLGALTVIVEARSIDLPGAETVGALLGVLVLFWAVRGSAVASLKELGVFLFTGLAMAVIVGATDVRFNFYSARAEDRLRSRDMVSAREDFSRLERYVSQRPSALGRLGDIAARLGDDTLAKHYYHQVLSLDAADSGAAANLAWLLATAPSVSPDESREALALARRAAAETNRRDANILDTLAAAEASSGAFANAAKTARIALAQAENRKLNGLARGIRERIELYERGVRWTR